MMLRRSKIVFLPLLVFGFLLGPTTAPVAANSYPGLVEKEFYHGNDILNARIAIEVNSSDQGRFRFRLQCFFTDANGHRIDQTCDFDPGIAEWCDLTTNDCFRRELGLATGADVVWTGTYRTLANNHTYAARILGFRAYFYHSGYLGAWHNICTKKVIWHTGGSPTIGGYAWSSC
jgi:hypothetical protein